jgi:Leucine-rich repeat (LRR) protein
MFVVEVRSLVFGFLGVREVLTTSYLVCRAWNGTRAAWTCVTSSAALKHAVPSAVRKLDMRHSEASLEDVSRLPHLEVLGCGEDFLRLMMQTRLYQQLRQLLVENLSDTGLASVGRLEKLEALEMNDCRLRDLGPVWSLTSLTTLVLNSPGLHADLLPVRNLVLLEHLEMVYLKLAQETFAAIGSLPKLRTLELGELLEDVERPRRAGNLGSLELLGVQR